MLAPRSCTRCPFSSRKPLFETLMTIHNLHFYQDLMRAMRTAIEQDRFAAWRDEFHVRYMAKRGD